MATIINMIAIIKLFLLEPGLLWDLQVIRQRLLGIAETWEYLLTSEHLTVSNKDVSSSRYVHNTFLRFAQAR